MSKEVIDDELWSISEPLLPARAPRNRQYAGSKPTPDRAVLTDIVLVLRSSSAWNLLSQEMGLGRGTPASDGSSHGRKPVSGNVSAERCKPNCAVLAKST